MSSNYCVCCGDEVPEGRMICPKCESMGCDNTKEIDAAIEYFSKQLLKNIDNLHRAEKTPNIRPEHIENIRKKIEAHKVALMLLKTRRAMIIWDIVEGEKND